MYILFLFLVGSFPSLGAPCKLGSYLNEKLILKGRIFYVLCEVWFLIFASTVLFLANIFYCVL